MDGFTITGGRAERCPTPEVEGADIGGGIYVDQSSIWIANCNIVSNTACASGGAYVKDSPLFPVFENCKIEDNHAISQNVGPDSFGGFGGGIYADGSGTPNGSGVRVLGCVFNSNTANGSGGGMYNFLNARSVIEDCTFKNNEAKGNGGGVYFFRTYPKTCLNRINVQPRWRNPWNSRVDFSQRIHSRRKC